MILVAGGTGRLGTLVVSRLAADGLPVRVLTRDPIRAGHLDGVSAEIVHGDLRDRASVQRAMAGVTTAVSAVHGFGGPGRVTPASVDRDGNANLIAAAASENAAVVLVSVVGASMESPMELFRAKHDAEQHLKASGLSWTIVRATAFVELWAEIMARPIVFGVGDNPINFVSVHDVAAAVERAVVDVTLRGQVLEVGGPQNLTFNEFAALLLEVRRRRRRIRHVPRWLLQAVAPFSRRAGAAVAMDTIDLTFDSSAAPRPVELPTTDVRTALTRAAGERQLGPRNRSGHAVGWPR